MCSSFIVRGFPSAKLMLKENRHCLNNSEQPFEHRKKGKWCLSGVFRVAVSAWKASSFAPDAWTISCERQTTADQVLVYGTSKRLLWLILPVPGAFVTFHAMKSKARKTTSKIHDKSVKVKDCLRIQEIPRRKLRRDDTVRGFIGQTHRSAPTLWDNTRKQYPSLRWDNTVRAVSLGRHAGQPLHCRRIQETKKRWRTWVLHRYIFNLTSRL